MTRPSYILSFPKLIGLALVAGLSMLSGPGAAQTGPGAAQTGPGAAQAAPTVAQAPESIGEGDTVHVTVFQNPDLTVDSRVAADGTISYPLLGQVKIGGLNPAAA